MRRSVLSLADAGLLRIALNGGVGRCADAPVASGRNRVALSLIGGRL
jgi:hypothetical protein